MRHAISRLGSHGLSGGNIACEYDADGGNADTNVDIIFSKINEIKCCGC